MADLKKFLTQLDDEQKNIFKAMPREDQLLSILSIELSNSNRLANVEKKQITMETDIQNYRIKREKREDSGDNEIMNTTQKILKALAQSKANEFNVWLWFRDKVLPGIVSLITLGVLYLVFGGKLP